MAQQFSTKTISKKIFWTGWFFSGLTIAFLLFDSIGKLMQIQPVLDATAKLSYPLSVVPVLGTILLICTLLYTIPKTSVLGAILLTGYLGGAVATHVRVEDPLFSHTLFPVYVGIILWGGLFLRDLRVRDLIPLRK